MTQRRYGPLIATCMGTMLVVTACAAKSPEAGRPNIAPVTSSTQSAQPNQATPRPNIPPVRPESAKGLTLASAELFIRHYIDLMNYSARTGDTNALRDASDAGCVGCGKYYTSVETVNEQNGGLRGDYRENVVEVVELTRTEQKRLAASTAVTVGEYTARRSPTAAPVTVKFSAYTEEMVLSPSGGNWHMFEMELANR